MTHLLALFLVVFGSVANAGDCRGDLASVGQVRELDPALRQAFIDEFAEMVFADEFQNQRWIDDALNVSSIDDIHVLIENSWIKKLNDKIFKNKDLVTALTNYHKKLFLEEFRKRAVALKFEPYQDFKSTRLTLPGPVDPLKLSELEAAFIAANKIFYASDRLKQILRAEDMKDAWFRMGVGQSENQAALAARDAREHGGAKNLSYFWDPLVTGRFTKKLGQIKIMQSQITDRLKNTNLLVKERDWTGLHIDIFAAARKAQPNDFLETLNQLFPGQNLDPAIAHLILEYSVLADEFSPSVLVAKRELLTIHDAPYGAFSLDFIGLGAENLRGTVKALAEAKDLNDAVRLTRLHEREVTEIFHQRIAMVRSAVEEYFKGQISTRFSGDDGILIPGREVTLRDQLYMIQKLSQLMPRPFFRMSMINAEGAAHAGSSQIITHGESIEKVLRQMLLGGLGSQRLSEISLETFIPDAGNHRKVFLIMGAKKKFTEAEKKVLRNAFPTAVKIVESQVKDQGLAIEYNPTEIFAIFGKRQ